MKKNFKEVRGRKDYTCLVCKAQIPKGTIHISKPYCSPFLEYNYAKDDCHTFASFDHMITLRFCSQECKTSFWRQVSSGKIKKSQIWERIYRLSRDVAQRRGLEKYSNVVENPMSSFDEMIEKLAKGSKK